jgi:ATP-dependent RNA helicase DDX51/DBP6
MGIGSLFATQAKVIPTILKRRQNDVCVAAPTGSGKTLTYVLPIVQRLATRVVVRLRALVVVPSRDLVSQVHDVFARFCGPLGLRVGSAHGQTSFRQEQDSLVDMHAPSLPGGTSKVDILVCTPGRLMDHLQTTKGFTLQHLSFLVIDEADRLLAQHYNDWVHQVLLAAHISKASLTCF